MKNLCLLLFLTIACSMSSQVTSGDCAGAIILCGDLYTEESAPPGTGFEYEYTGVCNQNLETMSLWYTFTVYSPGELSFILTPNDLEDDYDWGLFNITNGGCDGIAANGTSPEVSCNSWGSLLVPNGATGISTANGGISNSGGPGDQFGPPFNANLNVQPGQTYALVVMNWSNSQNGYTIDFSESTASLYDQVPPEPVSLTTNCQQDQFIVTFSENVQTSSADDLDFLLTGPQGEIAINDVLPFNPSNTLEDQYLIFPSNLVNTPGTYTLTITDVSGSVIDPCGNPTIGQVSIELIEPLTFQTAITTACNGSGGMVEVTNIAGGTGGYQFQLNGNSEPDLVADNLTPGNYTGIVTDDSECTSIALITIPDHSISVFIPDQDTLSCDQPELQIDGVVVTPQQNVMYSWSFLSENGFENLGQNVSDPMISEPGIYTIQVQHDNTGCEASAAITIAESEVNDLAFEYSTTYACNDEGGEILVTSITGGTTPYSLFLNGEEQLSVLMQDLIDTSYELLVLDSNGCSIEEMIEVPHQSIVVTVGLQDSIACNHLEVHVQNVVVEPVQSVEYNWYWYDSAGDMWLYINQSVIDPLMDQTGTYMLMTINAENGCTDSTTMNIYSTIPTNFVFDVITTSACNGLGGSLEVTSISQGVEPYVLQVDGVNYSGMVADGLNAGDVSVSIIDANECITEMDVEIPDHEIQVEVPQQNEFACNVSEITVEGVEILPAQQVTYAWYYIEQGNQYVQLPFTNNSPILTEIGNYAVIVESDVDGCADEFLFEVEYNNDNSLSMEQIVATACNGENGSIEVINLAGGLDPYSVTIDSTVEPDFMNEELNPGNHTVTLTDAYGCILVESVSVPDHSIGVVVPEQDRVSCSDPLVEIEGVEVYPDQSVTYQWQYFNGSQWINTGSNDISPVFSSSGSYELFVTNTSNDCMGSFQFEIDVGDIAAVDLSKMVFPNVVTANKDSKNEDWKPFLSYDPTFDLIGIMDIYELLIFNRWGNIVFDSSKSNSGRWSITDEESGVYFYTLVYNTTCGGFQEGKKEGTIHILR